MQEKGIEFDVSGWPIVLIRPTSHLSNQSIQDFFSAYLDVVQSKRQRHAIILDFSKNMNLIRKLEKPILTSMKESQKLTSQYIVGVALVFNSPVIRAIAMPFFWLFDPKYPTEVCKTVEEAMDWVGKRLEN